jgi:hypothetical protein
MKPTLLLALVLAAISLRAARAKTTDSNPVAGSRVAVVFTGGYDTNPLTMAARWLWSRGRSAFRRVKPAPAGEAPDPAQVRLNKQALLDTLEPYGVTNDRLDAMSNYYRYNRSRGEWWRHRRASAYALVRHGVITGFDIINPGSGYSSAPQISVPGYSDVSATATLTFGPDFAQNGSIKAIKLAN